MEQLRAAVDQTLSAPLFRIEAFCPTPLVLHPLDFPVERVLCGTATAWAFRDAVRRAVAVAADDVRVGWLWDLLVKNPVPSHEVLRDSVAWARARGLGDLADALQTGLMCRASDSDRITTVDGPDVAGLLMANFAADGVWPMWRIVSAYESEDVDEELYRKASALSNLAYILRGATDLRDYRQSVRSKVENYASVRPVGARDRRDVRLLADAFLEHPTLYNLLRVVGLAPEPTLTAV